MNECTSPGPAEPTLADVQRAFPGWECWRGTSGLHARGCTRPQNHRADVQGEDPLDLRDQIRGAEGREGW